MSLEPKSRALLLGAAVTLVIVLFVSWASLKPPALDEPRQVTVVVHHGDGRTAEFPVKTTARVLLDALAPCDFVELGATNYGYRVIKADGEAADAGAGVFWVFTVNGEIPEDRADTQPIADGDVFDYYIQSYL